MNMTYTLTENKTAKPSIPQYGEQDFDALFSVTKSRLRSLKLEDKTVFRESFADSS